MNTLIKNIQEYLGNESDMYEFSSEKYAGSEVAEELLALDDMDNLEAAMESMGEGVLGFALLDQEIALESAGLGITEFSRYDGTLGTETLANMARRGGYNVIIAIKKMISKIWKFVTTIIDFFIICDGRWKSYSKLAKKYKTKLYRLKSHGGEDENDKEYSIRNVADAATFIRGFIDAMSRSNFHRDAPTGTNVNEIATNVSDHVNNMMETVGTNMATATGNRVQNIQGTTGSSAKERLDDVKDLIKDLVEHLRDAEDVPVEDAKERIGSALSVVENATRREVKWFKQYKKMVKDIERQINKVGGARVGDDNSATHITSDDRNAILDILGETMQRLVEFKKVVNAVMKEVGSAIQMVLADAAKVIAGETRIGD